MLLFFLVAVVAPSNIPDRHFYDAHWAVDNAVTCVDARSGEAAALSAKLGKLEQLARQKGLAPEMERQHRALLMDYASSLRIRCAGGKRKAFSDARAALLNLERLVLRYSRTAPHFNLF